MQGILKEGTAFEFYLLAIDLENLGTLSSDQNRDKDINGYYNAHAVQTEYMFCFWIIKKRINALNEKTFSFIPIQH